MVLSNKSSINSYESSRLLYTLGLFTPVLVVLKADMQATIVTQDGSSWSMRFSH